MPLIRVSNKTQKELERQKKKKGFKSFDQIVWNGVERLNEDKQKKNILEPTQDWDIFKKNEDFSL